jgi:hypothetical protein
MIAAGFPFVAVVFAAVILLWQLAAIGWELISGVARGGLWATKYARADRPVAYWSAVVLHMTVFGALWTAFASWWISHS